MKRGVALVALGLLVPILQGAVTPFLPRGTCPDLGLLLVIALGVGLRSAAGGVALAAWIGFVSDLLSGSLFGQHALLRVLAFGTARLTGRHMNLQGAFTQMALAAGLTVASAFGMVGLSAFFAGSAPVASGGELLWHTGVNALITPFVLGLVARLITKLDGDEGRRLLRLEPRSYSA